MDRGPGTGDRGLTNPHAGTGFPAGVTGPFPRGQVRQAFRLTRGPGLGIRRHGPVGRRSAAQDQIRYAATNPAKLDQPQTSSSTDP
jgi:hypothetical protein